MLSLIDVQKSFVAPAGAEVVVVDVPRFDLEAGEQVALRGPSGSGKTTLLHLIAGVLAPDRGQVVLEGENLAALPEARRDRRRAEKIGYVFQTFNLLQGLSVQENVELGMAFGSARPDRERVRRVLERLDLAAQAKHFPRQLSTGQQQRVAVARAMINRPRLVLADEPTGNLDPVRAQAALTLIRELCAEERAALLLVSHDEAVLQQFSQVLDLAQINRAASREERA